MESTVSTIVKAKVLRKDRPDDIFETVRLEDEVLDKLNKMTKHQLIESLASVCLEAEVYENRCHTAVEDSRNAEKETAKMSKEVEKYKRWLAKSESDLEQARAMLHAIIERWYDSKAMTNPVWRE